jgi:DNA-directed RNA polymerase alpha subunit
MITSAEYEQALRICLQYKSQINAEVESVTDKLLVNMSNNGEISIRLFNVAITELDYFLPYLKGVDRYNYQLSDLLKLEPYQLLKIRNVGKKTVLELKNLKEKYSKL